MTDKQILALMIRAQSKPVVILCRTEEYADRLRQEIKDGVFKLFPTLLGTYITTGYDIFIKGHEKITVVSVPAWNELQRKAMNLFPRYAYCAGCTIDDIAGVKNLMYDPERIDGI